MKFFRKNMKIEGMIIRAFFSIFLFVSAFGFYDCSNASSVKPEENIPHYDTLRIAFTVSLAMTFPPIAA